MDQNDLVFGPSSPFMDSFPTIETWMSTVKVSYYLNSRPVEAVAPWIVPSYVPYGVVVELGYPVKEKKNTEMFGFRETMWWTTQTI